MRSRQIGATFHVEHEFARILLFLGLGAMPPSVGRLLEDSRVTGCNCAFHVKQLPNSGLDYVPRETLVSERRVARDI